MPIKTFEELADDCNKRGWIVLAVNQIDDSVWQAKLQKRSKELIIGPYAQGRTASEALRAAMANSANMTGIPAKVEEAKRLQDLGDALDKTGAKQINLRNGLTLMQASVLEKLIHALNLAVVNLGHQHGGTGSED